VITRFRADELLVAGRTYLRGADLAHSSSEGQHDGNPRLVAAVASSSLVKPVRVPR
jgi:hypothetical protein